MMIRNESLFRISGFHRFLSTAVVAGLAASCLGHVGAQTAAEQQTFSSPPAAIQPQPAQVEIHFVLHPDAGQGYLEVLGLPDYLRRSFAGANPDRAQWRAIFPVYAGASPEAAKSASLAMLGDYELSDHRLRFQPRVPFHPGVSYFARLDFDEIREFVQDLDLPRPPPELVFDVPDSPGLRPTRVERISPESARLPENLLRLYVTFSAPMGHENPHKFITLTQDGAGAVDLPFVEVPQGLWDASRTRLTLFFHPGRLKRGVGPNAALGTVLKQGKSYRLTIAGDWRDATGRHLATGFEKRFQVLPADRRSPVPRRWAIAAPPVASHQPLTIELDEPLDEALLRRFIIVEDESGQKIAGDVSVTNHQTRWRFTPQTPWAPGRFNLLLNPALEDLAGNRLDRLFEIDISEPRDSSEQPEPVVLTFTVSLLAGGEDGRLPTRNLQGMPNQIEGKSK